MDLRVPPRRAALFLSMLCQALKQPDRRPGLPCPLHHGHVSFAPLFRWSSRTEIVSADESHYLFALFKGPPSHSPPTVLWLMLTLIATEDKEATADEGG